MKRMARWVRERAYFTLAGLRGGAYFDPVLRRRLEAKAGPYLLHISDTPWEIYPFLRRLMNQLKPSYVVHTGDLVDDLKLEYDRNKHARWHARMRHLLALLASHEQCRSVIVAGNHDDADEIDREILAALPDILPGSTPDRARIRRVEPGRLTIEGIEVYVDHYGPPECARAALDLYGHDKRPGSALSPSGRLLNGIECAWVIDLGDGNAYPVGYPMDTDRYRLLERSRGGM